jgi:hypothetical protein
MVGDRKRGKAVPQIVQTDVWNPALSPEVRPPVAQAQGRNLFAIGKDPGSNLLTLDAVQDSQSLRVQIHSFRPCLAVWQG